MADRRPQGSRSFAAFIAMVGQAGTPQASVTSRSEQSGAQVSRAFAGTSKVERGRNMVRQYG